jgi:hypothetical protein
VLAASLCCFEAAPQQQLQQPRRSRALNRELQQQRLHLLQLPGVLQQLRQLRVAALQRPLMRQWLW